jgi:hypothetical protein
MFNLSDNQRCASKQNIVLRRLKIIKSMSNIGAVENSSFHTWSLELKFGNEYQHLQTMTGHDGTCLYSQLLRRLR